MDLDDMMKPKKPAGPALGESLLGLSTDELNERLILLEAERSRIAAEIGKRKASREAAEMIFKP